MVPGARRNGGFSVPCRPYLRGVSVILPTGLGSAPVPHGGGIEIARHAGSVVVHQAEVELRVHVTGFRQRLPQSEGGVVVAAGCGIDAGFEIAGNGWRRGEEEDQEGDAQLHGRPLRQFRRRFCYH